MIGLMLDRYPTASSTLPPCRGAGVHTLILPTILTHGVKIYKCEEKTRRGGYGYVSSLSKYLS